MTTTTFLGDPELKTDLLAQIVWHQEQDAIIQGTYGTVENGKWQGCAVGCSLHSLSKVRGREYVTSDHSLYESELGIPEWLARLEDTIFEGLPIEAARAWRRRGRRHTAGEGEEQPTDGQDGDPGGEGDTARVRLDRGEGAGRAAGGGVGGHRGLRCWAGCAVTSDHRHV